MNKYFMYTLHILYEDQNLRPWLCIWALFSSPKVYWLTSAKITS